MPWIDSSTCTGCGICEQNCPADAIEVHENKAELNQDNCIHCGICHNVCPMDAVRHDSELIPGEITEQIEWIATLRTHPHYANDPQKQKQLIGRLKNHFNKKIKVEQQVLAQLNTY